MKLWTVVTLSSVGLFLGGTPSKKRQVAKRGLSMGLSSTQLATYVPGRFASMVGAKP